MLVGDASCEREVAREIGLGTAEAEARRLAAEQLDVVGHLVVEREVAHGDDVEAGVALQRPVALAQLRAHGLQRGGVDLAAPMALEGELQFALRAHARETKGMSTNHDKPEFE